MMKVTLLILVIIIVIFLVYRRKKTQKSIDESLPFYYKELGTKILSDTEHNFYKVLKLAIGEYHIFAKVREADLTEDRSSKEILDFVICDRDTTEVIGVIKLNRSNQDKKESFPTFHFNTMLHYSSKTIKKTLTPILEN
ncbi:DUF2726 domain-containing protein [Pseudoalteromonas sp. Of11M-6]|uniref:DUF2726 domain-containing protein n=1 Tax=Pseudoalteromonas sp. Of11M-6 TaxID=2917754 RepID=UPI001EF49617|nr:DUF2726 domain-containing protein [Pseudoalteromonas sp. Of11M-6]MCG7556080.1 DUF2726 domain-containing protein [Pseudoalteromonas sp. Of11M-6]